ncbi:MAG: hypothetical protein M1823_000500 [Watsoniomyces obsoletus]|nr:MAG: hypothetical protein M1823_000500 [Watsoniomyces obsoletus]
MNAVAEEAKVQNHHPEWSNIYNQVFIRWTTHRPRGMSRKDLHMAQFCDEQAREMEEVKPTAEPDALESRAKEPEKLQELVDELDRQRP